MRVDKIPRSDMFHVGHSNSSLIFNHFLQYRRHLHVRSDVRILGILFSLYLSYYIRQK